MTIDPQALLPRFEGTAVWASLTPEQQAEIGAIALELVVAINGCDAYYNGAHINARRRPFEAAQIMLYDMLFAAVGELQEHIPALADDALPIPIPSKLGAVCRSCGCSYYDPCEDGCGWAEPDLCTACAGGGTHD
jgi:hypothetical protein